MPGPAAGALNITAKDLLKRKVLNLGWDGRKLQVLFPELMARLAGNELPLSGQSSHAVARLTEYGTRVQDDLRYIFSAPMLNRYLERMLGQDGMTMPTLVREGGTLTDTYGDVTVQVELEPDPLVLSNYTFWDEGVAYGFDESGQASVPQRRVVTRRDRRGWIQDREPAPRHPASAKRDRLFHQRHGRHPRGEVGNRRTAASDEGGIAAPRPVLAAGVPGREDHGAL